MNKYPYFILILLISSFTFAQNDTIKLNNGDVIVGRVKSMDKSILTFATKYSDDDFTIYWLNVIEFNSPRNFIIAFNDGERINTKIHMNPDNPKEIKILKNNQVIHEKLSEIVLIDRFDHNFFSRLHASIDFGVSLKKDQNYKEMTGNLILNYPTQHWKYSLSASTSYSKQDSTSNISRNEIDATVVRFFKKDWFAAVSVNLLSSSVQNLKLRITENLGGGYFFINSNQYALGAGAGLAFNSESYTDNLNPKKNSLESFLKVQFFIYDIGNKVSLNASVMGSPSITEKRRFRLDSNFYIKYQITSDLYIKTSLTYNFDNQPAEGASRDDYVLQPSFGWDNN